MEAVVEQAESRGVDRSDIAASTMFVSHETYTPARGGSAAAEVHALRRVFGDAAEHIVITNTKGFTGHAMGAGIEDVVAVKALETGLVPPVPNYREVDPDLGVLNLSRGGAYPVRYALRLAAGFGSQVAMALLRWTPLADGQRRAPGSARSRLPDRRSGRLAAVARRARGHDGAQLEVDHRACAWSTSALRIDTGVGVVAGSVRRSTGRQRPPVPAPAAAHPVLRRCRADRCSCGDSGGTGCRDPAPVAPGAAG
jgi:hypothetical protein